MYFKKKLQIKEEENFVDVHKRKGNEWTSITSTPPISSYIFLHIVPSYWPSNRTLQ